MKKETTKVSTYKANVLNVNSELKKSLQHLKTARTVLLSLHNDEASELKLSTFALKALKASKKMPTIYKAIEENTRKTKAGNITPFSLLQALHRLSKNEAFKIEHSL